MGESVTRTESEYAMPNPHRIMAKEAAARRKAVGAAAGTGAGATEAKYYQNITGRVNFRVPKSKYDKHYYSYNSKSTVDKVLQECLSGKETRTRVDEDKRYRRPIFRVSRHVVKSYRTKYGEVAKECINYGEDGKPIRHSIQCGDRIYIDIDGDGTVDVLRTKKANPEVSTNYRDDQANKTSFDAIS